MSESSIRPCAAAWSRCSRRCASATRDRVDNEVLAFSGSAQTTRDVVDGIPVTRLGSVSPARSTPIAPAMMQALRRSTADLIVLHEPNPWGLLVVRTGQAASAGGGVVPQ